jgi:hypothetical protein
MSQKYALKVKGGPGEMRAMMNLVNGWQFTGIGPFYMKDSATAQNILSSGISARLGGQAAADIMNAAADLAKAAAGFTTSGGVDSSHPAVVKMSSTLAALPLGMCPQKIDNFAEIHVYEPHLTPEGRMEWNEIVNLSKSREYLGYECVESVLPIPKAVDPKDPAGKTTSGAPGGLMSAVDSDLGKAALSAVFGPTLNDTRRARPGVLTSGEVGTQLPSSGINQIQVDGGCGKGAREFNVINFGGICNKPDIARPVISNRRVVLPPGEAAPPKDKSLTDSKEKPGAVGGTSSGAVNQVPIPSFNQNITQQVLPPTVLPAPSPPKDPTPKGPGGTSVVPPELILPPVPNPPK